MQQFPKQVEDLRKVGNLATNSIILPIVSVLPDREVIFSTKEIKTHTGMKPPTPLIFAIFEICNAIVEASIDQSFNRAKIDQDIKLGLEV